MIEEELVGEWTNPPSGGGLPVPEDVFISNIRENCKRDLPNLNVEHEHEIIMLMVCGGASAKTYKEEIRKKSKEKNYMIFCSNKTHDWLIENGIIPDYFFMIDPKKSKIDDVKKPHKCVHYLIGAQCDVGVFEALEGYRVTRILTYSGAGDGIKDYQIINAFFDKSTFTPLQGGTMAGLRAMTLADILGYRKVEFYGFDSCFYERDEKGKPIYYSYKKKRKENILEAETDDGRVFQTTPVFASQARQFIKWKHKLEWIDFKIHGDSLTSHIDELDTIKSTPSTSKLITPYSIAMNEELHKSSKLYGSGFHVTTHAGKLSVLIAQLLKKHDKITMLDYGCGKGKLIEIMPPMVGVTYNRYDPCIEEFNKKPEPSDVVTCTDVLEHIEPECLVNVLNDLQRVTKKVLYLCVAIVESSKYYSDGKNTHLICNNYDWWYPKLKARFNIIESIKDKEYFTCMLQAKEVR